MMYECAHVCLVCVCVCVCVVHCVAVCVGSRYRISLTRCRTYSFSLLLIFVQLLFEGGVYLFGKLVGINHDWIRYIQ